MKTSLSTVVVAAGLLFLMAAGLWIRVDRLQTVDGTMGEDQARLALAATGILETGIPRMPVDAAQLERLDRQLRLRSAPCDVYAGAIRVADEAGFDAMLLGNPGKRLWYIGEERKFGVRLPYPGRERLVKFATVVRHAGGMVIVLADIDALMKRGG